MNQTLCATCCYHAIKRGLDWSDLVDGKLSDGTEVHDAVTIVNGDAVCWYHVQDSAEMPR